MLLLLMTTDKLPNKVITEEYKGTYNKAWVSGAPLTSMVYLQPQHGKVIMSIIKCGMKLLIHSKTSTVQPLKSGQG